MMKVICSDLNERLCNINPFRVIRLFAGFTIIAFGTTLMLNAGLGLNPWGTFTIGLMKWTGLSFGRLSQLIGLGLITITFLLGSKPKLATFLDMIVIGQIIDFFGQFKEWIQPEAFLLQLGTSLGGLVIFSVGVYLYLSSGYGAGPRDGFVIALMNKADMKVTYVKPMIEISVMTVGILMGGTIGIGTVIVALLGGKILDVIFGWMDFDPRQAN